MSVHWSQDQSKHAAFLKSAKGQGYDDEEKILAVLGVNELIQYRGSIGDALNALYQVAEKAKVRGDSGHSMSMDSMEIATIPDPESAVIYGDPKTIMAIAHRAKRFFSWAQPKGKETDLDDFQIIATIQYCKIIGANPSNEIHAYWDKKNKVFQIVEHYSFYVRMAREQDPRVKFSFTRLPADDERLDQGDLGVICTIQTGADQDYFVELLRSNVPYEDALRLASVSAIGILKKAETAGEYNNPPKGWNWWQRAETRALRNAIKRCFGTVAMHTKEKHTLQAVGLLGAGDTTSLDQDVIQGLVVAAVEEELETVTPAKTPEETLNHNHNILHGDEIVDGTFTEEEPDPLVEEAIALGAQVITEEEREDRPVPLEKPKRRSWPADTIGACIKCGVIPNAQVAIRRLNKSLLPSVDDVELAVQWLMQYGESRGAGSDSDESAMVANTWLSSKLME